MQLLLGLFYQGVDPGEISRDVGAQKPEGGDRIHLFSIYNEGGVDMFVPPEVLYEFFFCFFLRKFSFRLFSEHHQWDKFSTSALYAVLSPSEMSPTKVVSLAYLPMTLVGWVGVRS